MIISRTALLVIPALIAGTPLGVTSSLSAEGVRVEPEGGDLAIMIMGTMEEADPESFTQSVLSAVPEDLLDRNRNFTQHPAYVGRKAQPCGIVR